MATSTAKPRARSSNLRTSSPSRPTTARTRADASRLTSRTTSACCLTRPRTWARALATAMTRSTTTTAKRARRKKRKARNSMKLARSDSEIDEQLNRAIEAVDSGNTNWPGMSYEQGVDNALRWITGQTDDQPMEDD